MGNTCSATPTTTDAVELLPDANEQAVIWDFINPRKNIQKYGFLCSHGVSKWRIGFADEVFRIYDITQDVIAVATITDVNEDGFTFSATFNYVVRQTVYATPTIIRPRTLAFTFSLKDNIKHNLQTYGWRTKVGVYEKGHLLEYCGLV
jgi:hypothetical protein